MTQRSIFMFHLLTGLSVMASTGCQKAPEEEIRKPGSKDECLEDADCDDGDFCNGPEVCAESKSTDQGAGGAAPRGKICLAGTAPCLENQECLNEEKECRTNCEETEDADSDGAKAVECGGDDCADNDANRYPGNLEVCDLDEHDEDCDTKTFGSLDADDDGFTDARCCNEQDGKRHCGEDCNDSRRNVHPQASEVCDGFDNNCDGDIDEELLVPGFVDADGDGHGNPKNKAEGCPGTRGFVETAGDCDDDNPQVNPSLGEACDGIDNDCNPETLDSEATDQPWYPDADGDGFGAKNSAPILACHSPAQFALSYSLVAMDCDDSRADISPRAVEMCNARDDNCDGLANFAVGAGDYEDDDGDGSADIACGGDDCDDQDWRTRPGAPELADGRDNDCDGEIDEDVSDPVWFDDLDGDGFGSDASAVSAVEAPPGHVARGGDCAPQDTSSFPGAVEVCDNRDNDCDGAVDEELTVQLYPDADGDGFGNAEARAVEACRAIPGLVNDASDCDDSDPTTRPFAPEACGDLIDSDCDGRIDDLTCVNTPILSFLEVEQAVPDTPFDHQTSELSVRTPFLFDQPRIKPWCLGASPGQPCARVDDLPVYDQSWSQPVGEIAEVVGVDDRRLNVTISRSPCELVAVPSPATAGKEFGVALAGSGDILAVGAPRLDVAGLEDAGRAYAYERGSAGEFVLINELVPPARWAGASFGSNLAVGAGRIAVGVPSHAAAFDAAPNDTSEPSTGSVFVFKRRAGKYEFEMALRPTSNGNSLGTKVDFDSLTGTLIAGSRASAHYFSGAALSSVQVINGVGTFGSQVEIENNRAVIAEPWSGNNAGTIYGYLRANSGAPLASSGDSFDSYRLGAWDNFGTRIAASGGFVAAYSKEEGWISGVHSSNPGLGTGTDPCGSASEADFGGVYLYEWLANRLSFRAYIKNEATACNDRFGSALAMGPGVLAVGAHNEDTVGSGVSFDTPLNSSPLLNTGGVSIYVIGQNLPRRVAHVKSHTPTQNSLFGSALAMGDRWLAIGSGLNSYTHASPYSGADPGTLAAGEVLVCDWK